MTSTAGRLGPGARRAPGEPQRPAALPAGDTTPAKAVAVACGAASVLAQVAYPLLRGDALRAATVAAVVAFAAASVAHAAARHGARAGVELLLAAAGLGLAAEAVGVATGLPFGRYAYAGSLGPQLLGVPLVVPIAWTMMAYPALLAARRIAAATRTRRTTGRVVVALLGGCLLAAWDLFLDPQMVAAGHWTWMHPSPSLPGVPTVPLGNTGGWLLVGALLTAVLDGLLPRIRAGAEPAPFAAEALPAALLVWTWLGSVLANLTFFGRPQVALLGGVGMALVVVPYLLALGVAARTAVPEGSP